MIMDKKQYGSINYTNKTEQKVLENDKLQANMTKHKLNRCIKDI